jgi:4'-phosphopantetheinyl transferase
MLAILGKRVDVWRINLFKFKPYYDQFVDLLSQAEQERAARYVQQEDRLRSVITRAILRQLLGAYLDCSPKRVNFQYNAYEKPELAAPHSGLYHFNLSHSHEWIVYAIGCQAPVGIDIECINDEVDVSSIAQRFFHPVENELIQSLTGPTQMAAFFRCWARKEALLKALGEGLFFPLDKCQVSVAPDQPAQVLSMNGQDVNDWTLSDIKIADGFAAAVAIQGECAGIQVRDWEKQCVY